MDKKTSLVFIVLTYYPNREKIVALLNVLKKYPTILVDNTPTKKLKELPSHIHHVHVGKNSGYTGGINTGLQISLEQHYDWSIVLNDDMQLSEPIVQTLVTELTNSTVGIVGAYPRYLDTKRWTTRIIPSQSNEAPAYLSGSFWAIHRDVLKTCGLLFDPYFIFYEEVEYCVRARKHGFPLYAIELNGITHKESSSFEHRSFLHQYYLARNHLLFVERNAPIKVKLYELFRLLKTIIEHLHRKEWGALLGIRDYLFRRFGSHRQSLI